MPAQKASFAITYNKSSFEPGESIEVTVTRSGFDPSTPWSYRTVELSAYLGADLLPAWAIESVTFSNSPKSQYNPYNLTGSYSHPGWI